jgi:ATP-dependent Lhr-like helicase
MVVLVDGALVTYLERGGRTVLLFTDEEPVLQQAADALAATVRGHGVAGLTVERIDGAFALGTPFGAALERAGFAPNPKGMRLRG